MRAPLFTAMGPEITRSIIQNRVARSYDRGEPIFQQGTRLKIGPFVVIEGWVKLYREREGGDQVVVAIFTAGETFAELRCSSAIAIGDLPRKTVSPRARILRVDGWRPVKGDDPEAATGF